MKFLFTALAFTMLIACNSDKKEGEVTVKGNDGEEVTINTNEIVKATTEMKNKSEGLEKIESHTMDELKALMPEQLLGLKRQKLDGLKMSGLANYSRAEYNLNDSAKVEVAIFDCAGTNGAQFYNLSFLTVLNYEQDNDREYTKTTDFKGGRAVENCQKDGSRCEFTYFAKDRYLVKLTGEYVGMKQLKQAADEINFK